MNAVKQAQVEALRANTAYPIYRGIIGIITTILMVIAAINGIGAIVFGFSAMQYGRGAGFIALVFGIAFAVLTFYMAKFWKEAAGIAADIADAVIESSTR